MIESVFIMLLAMAFITFILGVEKWAIIYVGTSLLMWIVITVASFYIQVPGDTTYIEYTLNAVSMAFIFINVLLMIMIHFEIGKQPFPPRPGQGHR